MTHSTHFAPEDIMAFLDGELSPTEAQGITTHLETCDECNAIADQFRQTSTLLSQWNVPQIPSRICAPETNARSPRYWKPWTLGFAGLAGSLVLLIFLIHPFFKHGELDRLAMTSSLDAKAPPIEGYVRPQAAVGGLLREKQSSQAPKDAAGYANFSDQVADVPSSPAPPPPPPPAVTKMARLGGGGGPGLIQPPLIARTASLAIQVKSVAAARISLDAIVARHRGYPSQLTAGTAENASPNLQASLRIPAPELASTIAELKTLGHVQTEAQSGEEVTQQHADLVARLTNARESETRLRAILQQRTGKVSDVLEVEEEITRVRGEIESMQAEQQTLEHRVNFATIDLQLSEQFKATLNSTENSASTRLHNAFVAGYRNASESLLDIILFFGEYGPALLIWTIILGLPILFAVRRYRNKSARI